MAVNTHIINSASPNPLKRAWAVVRADWGAYIVLNVLYYGLVIAGMIYVALFNPGLQNTLVQATGQTFTQGPLSAVGGAYGGGQVVNAIVLTFVVNLLVGSLVTVTLPGLIIPFSGLLLGVYRAILWGLLLSPANAGLAGPMIPHSLTLILEGQAYILAMLAVFIHGKAFLNPSAYGVTGHLRGYVEGLRRTGWIYLLVVILLAVAAIYESLEVIYLVPLFR
jgi:hypothetical protein